ncbi:PadR family transcriptional regulator [Nisaea acidiphila]|uniref:PadR family transcriptional regulator n=1 Tax=Nisaea acidiphila TaxID=1862145 RepID=A0A9J7AP43_9PROT|nr:PadR family transcriptional regulator [Nisaea acidiphila]UUX49184.1 PadR family transcriptional regulator [Nisaea acidiphila]
MDVKTLCLAVLSQRDATGYEIRKQFAEGPFAHFQKASLGAIYPALTKAAEEGLVTVTAEAQDGRPDKKIYSLTSAGSAALLRACETAPGDDQYRSDLLFQIFFACLQHPERISRLIDKRIAEYEAQIANLTAKEETCAGQPGMDFVRGLGCAIYSAAADYMRQNRGPLLEKLRSETRHAAE